MLSGTRSNSVSSSLEDIGKRSQALLAKKKRARFLDKAKDSQEVLNLIEQLRTAIVFYQVRGNRILCTDEQKLIRVEQVSQQRSIYDQIGKLTVRLLVDHVSDSPDADETPGSTSPPLTRS